MTFPIELYRAQAFVAIANLKFSIPNFQFRPELCGYAALVAAGRVAPLGLGAFALNSLWLRPAALCILRSIRA